MIVLRFAESLLLCGPPVSGPRSSWILLHSDYRYSRRKVDSACQPECLPGRSTVRLTTFQEVDPYLQMKTQKTPPPTSPAGEAIDPPYQLHFGVASALGRVDALGQKKFCPNPSHEYLNRILHFLDIL